MVEQLTLKKLTLNITSKEPEDVDIKWNQREQDSVFFIELNMLSEQPVAMPETELELKVPFVDIHSCWTPGMIGNPVSIRNKGIGEWRYDFDSKISKLAPVACFYNLNGQSRVAASLSETTESVRLNVGSYEEDRCGLIKITLFSEASCLRTEYKVVLRLDLRDIPFYEAIQGMADWYETLLKPDLMDVHDGALEPVYSTWYSFHQNLTQDEIEDQCRLAVEAGCKTIILDDGWQTDDNNRGYHYCGDWEVSTRRFPDFKGHVARVQEMGMKYMLWLSVPFVGKDSKVWQDFADNMLFYSDLQNAGVVDPRYPHVREYLITTYCRLVKDYHLDGLKLDFIDEFDMRNAQGSALEADEQRDFESLQEAINQLMTDVRMALEAINPNILIEFRQKYIGPMIRKFGNIFRVHDCPHDSIMNRASIMDLRMFSGSTAVHSDMFIWTPEDTVESASLHFINTLFSVPQISPDMKELSEEHLKMTKHWLTFWREHRDLLLKGELKCQWPEMQYPLIESQLGEEKIITVHAPVMVDIFTDNEKKLTLVNGALESSVVVKLAVEEEVEATIFDCLGNEVESKTLILGKGFNEISLPKSGYIVMTQ